MSTTETKWVPATDCLDDMAIAKGIVEWHEARGEAVPADALFQNATWEKPEGTVCENWGGYWGETTAKVMRVTLGSARYLLAVEWDGLCGCRECSGRPTYAVQSVEAVQ